MFKFDPFEVGNIPFLAMTEEEAQDKVDCLIDDIKYNYNGRISEADFNEMLYNCNLNYDILNDFLYLYKAIEDEIDIY